MPYFRRMIQRIQSIYLLLTVLVSAALFYLPLFELPSSVEGTGPREFMITSNALLLVLSSAIGVLAFVTIFLFKSRPLQIKVCRLILIMIFVMIGLLFYTSDTISNGLDQKVVFKIGTYLPLLQVLFIFLAHRAIKKDENLVRSADRLR
jgi:hypothetical protein